MYRLVDIDCGGAHRVRCFSPGELAIGEGDMCVFRMEDIQECGRVCGLTDVAGDPDASAGRLPIVLRRATLQDQSQANENILLSKSLRRMCEDKIRELELPMVLVRLRFSLDKSRLIVEFTTEAKVDLGDLARILKDETHAQVNMRQLGIRDAAAIVGGMAPCGRRLCCAEWLKEFENINVRMARIQGLSLSPATINGMCEGLKCCLRFEHNCYRDLARGMPRAGKRVKCPEGEGRVIATQILSRRVTVLLDDDRVLVCDADDIKTLGI